MMREIRNAMRQNSRVAGNSYMLILHSQIRPRIMHEGPKTGGEFIAIAIETSHPTQFKKDTMPQYFASRLRNRGDSESIESANQTTLAALRETTNPFREVQLLETLRELNLNLNPNKEVIEAIRDKLRSNNSAVVDAAASGLSMIAPNLEGLCDQLSAILESRGPASVENLELAFAIYRLGNPNKLTLEIVEKALSATLVDNDPSEASRVLANRIIKTIDANHATAWDLLEKVAMLTNGTGRQALFDIREFLSLSQYNQNFKAKIPFVCRILERIENSHSNEYQQQEAALIRGTAKFDAIAEKGRHTFLLDWYSTKDCLHILPNGKYSDNTMDIEVMARPPSGPGELLEWAGFKENINFRMLSIEPGVFFGRAEGPVNKWTKTSRIINLTFHSATNRCILEQAGEFVFTDKDKGIMDHPGIVPASFRIAPFAYHDSPNGSHQIDLSDFKLAPNASLISFTGKNPLGFISYSENGIDQKNLRIDLGKRIIMPEDLSDASPEIISAIKGLMPRFMARISREIYHLEQAQRTAVTATSSGTILTKEPADKLRSFVSEITSGKIEKISIDLSRQQTSRGGAMENDANITIPEFMSGIEKSFRTSIFTQAEGDTCQGPSIIFFAKGSDIFENGYTHALRIEFPASEENKSALNALFKEHFNRESGIKLTLPS